MNKEKELRLPTQLLIRDIEVLQAKNLLVIGAQEPELVGVIRERVDNLALFNFDYAQYQNLVSKSQGLESVQFGSWYKPAKKHDGVIVYLPKSEPFIRLVFSLVREIVEQDGKVYVIGQKNEGIKSQIKTIEDYFGPIEFNDSARHSTLYQARMTKPAPQASTLKDWIEKYEFTLDEQLYEVVSLPGVFSYGKLDDGTRLLLENIQIQSGAKVLDWGCGSGIIGLVIGKMIPHVKVDLVDSNALAVEAAKMTMELNGLPQDKIWASNIFSDVKEKYDVIISNPPFHSGVGTDYSIVEQFIKEAKQHLEPQGRLIIVANSFLRYKPLIMKGFGNCKTIAATRAYNVYEAVNLESL